jgi:O-antigen/teichoic acid export membrane protein
MLNFFRTQVLRNVFILSAGTIIGQAIPICLQPILRRLFTVEEFGSYAIYTSVFGVICVLSSLRYEMAIIQPKHDREAANVLSLSVLLNVLLCFLIFIIVLLFKTRIASLLSFNSKYSNWLYLAPISVFLFGSFRAINFWLIRKKAFRFSSFNKIYRRAGEAISQIGLGLSKSNSGLVISEIVGNVVNVISGVYFLFKKNFRLDMISWHRMKFVAKKYSAFPKYNTLPSFLDIASLQIPILIINHFYTKTDVAQFDLSRMILSVSLVLIGTSISQVIQQKVAEDKNNGQSIKKDFKSILLFLTILSLAQIVVIVFFAPLIFKIFFGAQWEMAGELSQILIFSYIAKFIVSPLSIIFVSLEKIVVYSIWQYSYFFSIMMLWLLNKLTLINFLYIYVGVEVIMYTLCLILLWNTINKYETNILIKNTVKR